MKIEHNVFNATSIHIHNDDEYLQEITDIELPSNLPMTPRMASRGYTSADLTKDTLKTMDLSYYSETPPDTNQSQRYNTLPKSLEDKTNKLPTIKLNKGKYPHSASSKSSSKKSVSAY